MDKLLIMYTPERTAGKAVYDCCSEMRDGELMINSGVCNVGPRSKLFYSGGLNSLLPILEMIRAVTLFGGAAASAPGEGAEAINLADLINDYLKLIIAIL